VSVSRPHKNQRQSRFGRGPLFNGALGFAVVFLGETLMIKVISAVAALGILIVSAPAFAQKKSCQEICLENYCKMAASKNFCMQKCVANCNMKRSSKS
jgi:hypothetical protein